MSDKREKLSVLFEDTAKQITSSITEWTKYLNTASRVYKYPFHEQLLIYAQKPEATACAEYGLWNKAMNRYVLRGSKGIGLIDPYNKRVSLKYVFDVMDTGGGKNAKQPILWEYQDKHKSYILEMFKNIYDVNEENIYLALDNIAKGLAREYYIDSNSDILDEIEENMHESYLNAVATSITYTILTRLGLETHNIFTDKEFEFISNINDKDIVNALGTAVSIQSQEVLREISKTIIKAERNIEHEIDLQTRGRLFSTELGTRRTADTSDRQVWQHEERLPNEPQANTVQQISPQLQVTGAFSGDRPDSEPKIGTDDARVTEDSASTEQNDTTNGVGSVHEQPTRTSRGSNFERTDLQLNNDIVTGEQISFFPTEQQQVKNIAGRQRNSKSRQPAISLETKLKSDKLARFFEYLFNSADTKYKGTFAASIPDIKVWDNVSRKKNVLSIYLDTPIANMGENALTYFNRNDKSDEIALNEALYNNPLISKLNEDKDFSVSFSPTSIDVYFHNIDDKEIDFSLDENFVDDESIIEPMTITPEYKEYLDFKNEYPDDIVLCQYATCFKAYGEEAEFIHKHFDITAYYHEYKSDSDRVPILGFAENELESYVDKLHDLGKNVVVINEENGTRQAIIHNFPHHAEEPTLNPQDNSKELFVGDVFEYDNKQWKVKSNDGFMLNADNTNEEDSNSSLMWVGSIEKHNYKIIERSVITAEYTPFFQSYLDVKNENQDNIVLYRLGDFFEAYGDDAKTMSEELDLTLTKRNISVTKDEKVPMVGFPAHSLDKFTDMLKENGHNILICEKDSENIKTNFISATDSINIEESTNVVELENFRITDDNLGIGTKNEKVIYNLEAIRVLKLIESENRPATNYEKTSLSKYVGWGGIPEIFEESNTNYLLLKTLLSEDEYKNARASVLNAHYTSPTIIKAMYNAIENMGFSTGNILEPSCGVGNFLGLLPDSMSGSKQYGVELDSITGRIAKQLYPNASIDIKGFEKTDYPDNFFDVAIGNVPFGDYSLSEKRYDKENFKIHDHFFAKSLDKVRTGGVVAFVTSKGTLDKKNSSVRKYLAKRAELLGAIRLPNTAFKANAGTEVTSDIIFLQKRENPIDIEPDWVHLGLDENNISMNSYFVENPDMILGKMEMVSGRFGEESTCSPTEDLELSEQLQTAIKNIVATIPELEFDNNALVETSIPADPNVKNFSYTLVNGEVYYRENSRMSKPELNAVALERAKGMIEIRQSVNDLIKYQLEEYSEQDIKDEQLKLNELYDNFTQKYGVLNARANALAFNGDNSYYLLTSLEDLNEDGTLKAKADMFTKRTIKPNIKVTSVDTPSEALAVSIADKACVDLNYMSQLLGEKYKISDIIEKLNGVIFKSPMHCGEEDTIARFFTADEYLSGNVREKLEYAKTAVSLNYPEFNSNVKALEEAQPEDLDASEIEVRLGATWINKDYIEQFMYETFETPNWSRGKYGITVQFANYTGEWSIKNKNNAGYRDVASTSTYGTTRANAYRILEDSLNLRDIRIYDTVTDVDGKEKRVLNKDETTLAQQKQQLIKDTFKEWIWKDPTRRQDLVELYNQKFNSIKPREFDGSHITFSGINPEINLREHQINAIAHILYGDNTLLAHEVGAGKSFEMVAGAMESKRLGLCNKPLFAVPNHLTEQMASEFLRLYPAANILVATRKDFETRNRKKFCARIATGEYDAVIMGHSQFERIPVSLERQERLLEEQIDEILNGISEVKASGGENFTVKQLERTKRGLEKRLEKLRALDRKDDVITFEQLGVDRLIIDEAHAYKNGFVFTKMRNVAGLGTTESQRSADMFMKCRYLDEITGGKGVVFATGTPVSNSMTEIYVMQRYLQYNTLKDHGLLHFDSWASTFGETTTQLEINPEGSGYRLRNRFSKFYNLPELMNMFKDVADIKTADQLNLPTPKIIYETVSVKPTDLQKEIVAELSKRASDVHANKVDPSEDNMLTITNDGRKLGLDQRVFNPMLPDDPNSKVNVCISKLYDIWEETKEDRLTQLVFCDLSTPKAKPKDILKDNKAENMGVNGAEINALELSIKMEDETELIEKEMPFSIYNDIKEKLINLGIPEKEIAFIHDAKTEVQKKELFAKVRRGDVRIMIGSTSKCGAGMNVQDRLVALHDLDAPWRPGDLRQRSGRIERQGNMNKEAKIFRYVTESTFDSYLWQTLENKQKYISQIMTSKSPVRACDDLDESVLSFAEIKALCAGNPKIKLKMDLDIEVAKLKLLKGSYQSTKYKLEDQLLKYFPETITRYKNLITGFGVDLDTLSKNKPSENEFLPMTIKGEMFTEKDQAGLALLECLKDIKAKETTEIGSYRGFNMQVYFDSFNNEHKLVLKGDLSHTVTLGSDIRGNLIRIDNALENIPKNKLEEVKIQLENLYNQQENAKLEKDKPFPQEQELQEKSKQLAKLDLELKLTENSHEEVQGQDDVIIEKSSRPSVINLLKTTKQEKVEPKHTPKQNPNKKREEL